MITNTRPVRTEQPPVDIFENPNGFLIRADMPGVTAETLSVDLTKGLLTVAGRRLVDPGQSEGPFMAYRRTFHVPRDTDPDAVSAHFDRGVLQIRLPRSEAAKPRKIPISVG